MKIVLLLFLALFFCQIHGGFGGNFSSRPSVVNIGALLTTNSTIGRVAKVAIDAAVEDVNSDPLILQGTKLVVHMQDSNCSGSFGVIEALQFMKAEVVAIIGPQSSAVAHVISYVADVRQIPLMSFSATDPSFSPLQYPFFVRNTQSDLFQMDAVADVVNYYQWKQVTAIFVDDDYGRNGVNSLADSLAAKSCKISYRVGLPSEATKKDVMDVLVKVTQMESRVIIVHVHTDIGLKVFSVAHRLDMIADGYVWITTDWLSSLLDSSPSLGSGTMDTMQGVIALRQHTMDSKNKNSLISKWSIKNRINSYGLYAYDTVWMIAHALNSFFNEGGTIFFANDSRSHDVSMTVFDEGKLLLDKILKSNFMGLTGSIRFNSDGNLVTPSYDILNVMGTGIRTIGYWGNYSGLSILPPETLNSKQENVDEETRQLYNVIWPGETTVKPRGWVFPNNGKELRIAVPNRADYRKFVSVDPNTGAVKGYCVDVFNAAINLLPYAVPYKFMPWGDGNANPDYNELVAMVASNDFDAIVGDITIITNRTKIVDFTQPFIESGLVILAQAEDQTSDSWAFLQPFTVQMWCVTALSFFIVGVVVWILEHRSNDEFRGPPKKQICTVFWFSFSTLFFAQKENTVSTLGRAVLIIWLFVVLIIQSSYTASLTSILTVQQLSSPIKGIESLISSNEPIGFQPGSYVENYLIEEVGISKSRLRGLGSEDEYARALELGPNNGGVAAVVDERPYIELFLSTQCKFSIVGSEFTKSGFGFAFQQGSPLAVDMSNAILELSENGDLQRIHDEWLSGNACGQGGGLVGSNQLHLGSFSGMFLICGLACVLALAIYFFRILRQFIRHRPHEEPETGPGDGGSSRGRVVQNFLSFVDDKEADVKDRSRRRQMLNIVSANPTTDVER